MNDFNPLDLKKLYTPPPGSHKGQNGKLLIIGGSSLFHAASLWALNVSSRIVDMVFYSSIPENNDIVAKAKNEFRNGIIVPRDNIENYLIEADCIVIGPGMMRGDKSKVKSEKPKVKVKIQNLNEINSLEDEGEQSYYLTKYLLEKYPQKKWVIDAGALQMMEPEWLKALNGNVIITPHLVELETILSKTKLKTQKIEEQAAAFAKEYNCIVLLKGQQDIVCPPAGEAGSPSECVKIEGGNAGMTKGGTGDVLAGLTGALACKNDLWLSAKAASYINKKAGDSLFNKVGYYFNSSDLADEIPRVMKLLLDK